ncbi:Anion exchange protein [Aphelenchoides besseyi]|nr:Anion exchange protein [Aphelenchoides besseyi]KAI6209322.1 Anion exchange protein [Aphelenchoides besseyi]
MPTTFGSSSMEMDMRDSEGNLRSRARERSVNETTNNFDLMNEVLFSPQSIQLGNYPDTPIDNVRRLLDSKTEELPALFCEMMFLTTSIEEEETEIPENEWELAWRQTARWVKFKQIVEGDGTRFSKPHITLLTVHGLLQVKTLLRKGSMLLDAECSSFIRLCDLVIKNWLQSGALEESNAAVVREVLYAPKLHLIDGHVRSVNESSVPISDHQQRATNDEEEDGDRASKFEDADEKLLRRLPRATESAAIMVANVGALQRPLSAFVRLKTAASMYPELPDQPYPVKFVYILLNDYDNYEDEALGIGYTLGALFSDEIFHQVAHNSLNRFTIADAVEEYFSQATLIPPGKCRPDTRWSADVNDDMPIRNIGKMYSTSIEDADDEREAGNQSSLVIRRSGRIFGGLVDDVKRKTQWYLSDFTDFFSGRISQSLGAVIVLFFSALIVALTFGAVYERATHQQMAAIESMVSASICGITFALFGGQPLTILSATGATFIFEKVVYDFCTSNDWEFLPFRFWLGCWVAFFFILLIATDASALVGLITRFTEEGFATLVSVAFIVQACQKIYEISYEAPITWKPQDVIDSTCYCLLERPKDATNETEGYVIKNLSIGVTRCQALGGTPQGLACFFKPDILIFSILLAICTFFVSMKLTKFRNSPYLAWKIRHVISDFGVVIAVVIFTLLSKMTGLDVPSLKFPLKLQPTMERSWVVDVFAIEGYHVALIAIVPAAFFTILLVMDQQISSGIINRKENKLRKNWGYHLDLLVLMALILTCALLGLPFYAASPVLTVSHVDSLKFYSEIAAPGETPRFLGVKEQRMTTLIAHILIGVSLFFAPVVKLVPMPVLTGVFLYVGAMSLLGQQYVQRLGLLFMPVKNQPDLPWLRAVRMHRVHLFTFIQTLSIILLFIIRYASRIAMVFPVMLVVMVTLRIFVLQRMFTHNELIALDDELPNIRRLLKPMRPKQLVLDLRKHSRQRRANNQKLSKEKKNSIPLIKTNGKNPS